MQKRFIWDVNLPAPNEIITIHFPDTREVYQVVVCNIQTSYKQEDSNLATVTFDEVTIYINTTIDGSNCISYQNGTWKLIKKTPYGKVAIRNIEVTC